jgi:hypothetical protein
MVIPLTPTARVGERLTSGKGKGGSSIDIFAQGVMPRFCGCVVTDEGKHTPPTTRTLDYLQVPGALEVEHPQLHERIQRGDQGETRMAKVFPNSPPQPSVSEQAEDIEKIEKLVLALAPHQPAHGQA